MALLFCLSGDWMHTTHTYIDAAHVFSTQTNLDVVTGYYYGGTNQQNCFGFVTTLAGNLTIDTGSTDSTLIFGVDIAYYSNFVDSAAGLYDGGMIDFRDKASGTVQIGIDSQAHPFVSGLMRLTVWNNGRTTKLGTTKWFAGGYMYAAQLEFTVVSHATTGSLLIKRSGETLLNLTNINTNPAGTALVNEIYMTNLHADTRSGTVINRYCFSQLIVMDSTGTSFNSTNHVAGAAGNVRVNARWADGNGFQWDFTSSFGALDESYGENLLSPTSAGTIGHVASFTWDQYTAGKTTGTIKALQFMFNAQTDAGTAGMTALYHASATTYMDTVEHTITTTPDTYYSSPWYVDPNTGVEFLYSVIEPASASSFGVKVTS